MLKIDLPTLLATHTEGQLRIMAIASRINYVNMKHRMDIDSKKSNNSPDSNSNKPPKPFKDMTKAEIEAYDRGNF